jgi:hypothetical protein
MTNPDQPLKVTVTLVSADNGRALGYYASGGFKIMVEFSVTSEKAQELISQMVRSEYAVADTVVDPTTIRSVRRGERFDRK